MASPTIHPYSVTLAGFIHYLFKLMYDKLFRDCINGSVQQFDEVNLFP